MSASEPTVITRRQGRIGRITLNRPKVLNALNLQMIELIRSALDTWRDDPAIHAVVIEGAGGRAFCAGGDIRWVRERAMDTDHGAVEAFFVAEYALNLAIAHYPKPYIALIDGVCMGGGIGLSVHGAIRVATDAAMFAMPETGIGLFPDIGASYFLPRFRDDYGMYLALTGARAHGIDAAYVGLATHYMARDRIATLADEMADHGVAVLAAAASALPEAPIAALAPVVECFAAESVAEIIRRLEARGDAAATLETLRAASPSSMLWSFELMRRGAERTLEQCQAMELALTRHATRHPDFIEGVRAMVVDKDRTPRWTPTRIEDVDPATIAAMFDRSA